jgi:hypothetical protein
MPRVIALTFTFGLLWSAPTAHAGMCIGEDETAKGVASLEAMAKNPKANDDRGCFEDSAGKYPKYAPRVLAGCEKILARTPNDVSCIDVVIRLGKHVLAGVDLFDAIASWKIDIWEWQHEDRTTVLLGRLGDPRGLARIVETWKAAIPEAKTRERKKWASSLSAWSGWRQDAARALGEHGGADDKAFLEDQAAATKDKYVKQACVDAIAAIDKRLTAAAPKP